MKRDDESDACTMVGPYRLTRHVATGGAGQIHVAVRGNDGEALRRYAVKTVLPSHQRVEQEEVALLREAQLGTQLLHPNIVAVHDYGRDGEIIYLAMDYVEGSDLRGILDNACAANTLVPDNVAAWIMSEVCEGLAFAHRLEDAHGRPLKLVHRDISPQNILVGTNGEIRIADFGVAHSDQEDRPQTEAGVIKGKLRYMSPEYLTTNEQDHRGDIFAAGLVLYELLANAPAYPKTDNIEISLQRISKGSVDDIRTYRPRLREDLQRILERALSPDPDRRYSNADDMAGDLKRFVWHASSGLTRARVAELLGVMGLFGDRWSRPRAVEASMTMVTQRRANPVINERARLDDTAPLNPDLLDFTDVSSIPAGALAQLSNETMPSGDQTTSRVSGVETPEDD